MRITIKGQVTIPQHIREKYKITPNSEINFEEKDNRVYLTKKITPTHKKNKFQRLRGIASIRMSTDEIMSLTRGNK